MLNSDKINNSKKLLSISNYKKEKEETPEDVNYKTYANTNVSLIGHSVSTESLGLIQFFYPNFKVMDKPSLFINSPVIWTGDAKYLNFLKSSGISVISVTKLSEYNLLDKDTLLHLTFSKWGKPVPKYVYNMKDILEYDMVLDYVKYHWVSGKWILKEYNSIALFLNFINNLSFNNRNAIADYFNLVDKTGIDFLDKSMFSFIARVVGVSTSDSVWYKQAAKIFNTRDKRHNIKIAIDNYLNSSIDNKELKLMNLVQDLIRLQR